MRISYGRVMLMRDLHVSQLFAQLRGAAGCRGERWAATVGIGASRCSERSRGRRTRQAAELAPAKVADLTRDPKLREQLAMELARGAARRRSYWSS